MKTSRLKEVLDQARQRLGSRLEADLVVSHALGQGRTYLYTHDSKLLSDHELDQIASLIRARLLGQPIAYILGEKEFYGRSFLVNEHVLIPRPETELLIDEIKKLDLPPRAKVADIGTGSGCIGLTLAAEDPQWLVCVTDLSNDALTVCQTNRERFGLMNVVTYEGSLLKPLAQQTFDLIVANLPYIAPEDSHLDAGDLRFEPQIALVAEDHGLALITELIRLAPKHLNTDGYLVLEHGYDQQEVLTNALKQTGFKTVVQLADLSGIPRGLIAQWS